MGYKTNEEISEMLDVLAGLTKKLKAKSKSFKVMGIEVNIQNKTFEGVPQKNFSENLYLLFCRALEEEGYEEIDNHEHYTEYKVGDAMYVGINSNDMPIIFNHPDDSTCKVTSYKYIADEFLS